MHVDSDKAELRDRKGFIGDSASGRAFRAGLEEGCERVRQIDDDPVGDMRSSDISKKLDRLLLEGDAEAAALVLGSIEKFAQEGTTVIRRLLRLKA